jgi:hypothetical protein
VPRDAPPVSRGTIIPALLASETYDRLLEQAMAIDTGRFEPFRLVLIGERKAAELRWMPRGMVIGSRVVLDRPLMFTSSGLGDERVDPPRRALFRDWFHSPADWAREQDAFHRHAWSEAPELSVCMRRHDARTVSYTVVEMTAGEVELRYFPAPPNEPVPAQIARLARA